MHMAACAIFLFLQVGVSPTVGRLVVSPVVAVPDVACCFVAVAVAVAVAADVAAAIAVFVWLNRYYGLPTTLVNMPPEHRPYGGIWMGELGSGYVIIHTRRIKWVIYFCWMLTTTEKV